jgi:hypothetical protein
MAAHSVMPRIYAQGSGTSSADLEGLSCAKRMTKFTLWKDRAIVAKTGYFSLFLGTSQQTCHTFATVSNGELMTELGP